MEKLIKNLSEQYQDVEHNGVFYPGMRDCSKRWKLIKRYIPRGVVLDIGSSQGYYTKKIAEQPDTFVISVEYEKPSVELQKELLKDFKNVAICKTVLTSAEIDAWAQTPDPIDCILILSVLHHFPDPAETMQAIAELSPRLIIEVPTSEETDACGQKSIKWISEMDLNKYYDRVQQIGFGESHMHGGAKRPIYYCENKITVKYALLPYIGYDARPEKYHSMKFMNEKWVIDEREIIPGVNLYNLLLLGMVYPDREWIKNEIRQAYGVEPRATDRRLWNLIMNHKGLHAIDTEDQFEELAPHESDFQKMDELLDNH